MKLKQNKFVFDIPIISIFILTDQKSTCCASSVNLLHRTAKQRVRNIYVNDRTSN